jgi:ankyrin repeat protein
MCSICSRSCRLSASLGDLATVRQLLAAGADVGAQGGSALVLARQAGHSNVAVELERAAARFVTA